LSPAPKPANKHAHRLSPWAATATRLVRRADRNKLDGAIIGPCRRRGRLTAALRDSTGSYTSVAAGTAGSCLLAAAALLTVRHRNDKPPVIAKEGTL
jgi:hypothetical protein